MVLDPFFAQDFLPKKKEVEIKDPSPAQPATMTAAAPVAAATTSLPVATATQTLSSLTATSAPRTIAPILKPTVIRQDPAALAPQPTAPVSSPKPTPMPLV